MVSGSMLDVEKASSGLEFAWATHRDERLHLLKRDNKTHMHVLAQLST
jgi:hypothetical protein